MSSQLDPRQKYAIQRIAGLILVNAMMFQEVLAQRDERVRNLSSFRVEEDLIGALADHWKYILDEINYFPIFHIALKLLLCISPDVDAVKGVRRLVESSRMVVGWRASLRHDLAGRLYHRLLAEAKFLGAYYTSVPSAVLLLKVALDPRAWKRDWANLKALRGFRIADLACGTGTLLMAAADVVVDNHIADSVKRKNRPRFESLQRVLMEDVIWGLDVLMSALHLTASTLMLRSSEVAIENTRLHCLPLGGRDNKLGSLEFSEHGTIQSSTLFSQTATQVFGKEARKHYVISLPQLDLCAMNPPFTRSVGGNLLFGNLPEEDRKAMQQELKRIVNRQNLPASITAGLGSVFIALADRYLKKEGRLALVLPRALLSGVAWEKTRALINENYHLEWVMVSHEPDHWNFSENTDLSEVLVIARKRNHDDAKPNEQVNCVNLWKQPRNSIEGLRVARQATESGPPDLFKGQGSLDIFQGEEKVGEAVSVPWLWLRKSLWNFPCAFAQADLNRSLLYLLEGKVYLPAKGLVRLRAKLKLCPLGEIAQFGFDRRDIHDGFRLATHKTAYPAFWKHDANRVFTLKTPPNSFLSPLPEAKENRPLRSAVHLWKKAGRLLIAERLRLNTMRLSAIRVGEKVLSNVWWTLVLKRGGIRAEKALALWLNSSLGILLLMGHREETQGAWIGFKKPVLANMPVLDVSAIDARATLKLSKTFDQLADKALLPFSHLAEDPVRADIDDAVASALSLPDCGIIRQLLAREPILSLSMNRLLQ